MAMDNRLMRPKKSGAAPFVYNAEALAWETAAIANGGTVSTSTLQAVSTFCDAIEAAGIRSKFLRLNLVCGGNLAAARTPLYRGASSGGTQYGEAIDLNVGPFTSGDYSESSGLQGNGSSKAFDTGLTIGTLGTFGLTPSSVHLSVYNRSTSAGASGPSFGAFDFQGENFGNACLIDSSDGGVTLNDAPEFGAGSGSPGDHEVQASPFAAGFHLAEFTDTASAYYGINGVSSAGSVVGGSVGAFESADTTQMYFCGAGPSYFSDQLLSAYSVGLPMSTAVARTAFWNAMLAFQTALGRNV